MNKRKIMELWIIKKRLLNIRKDYANNLIKKRKYNYDSLKDGWIFIC